MNFVAHSGGAQRLAEASRILADYGVYGNSLVGIAGPVVGSYNDLDTIGLVGSPTGEITSNLQYVSQFLLSAGGSSENVDYTPVPTDTGTYIPHRPPIPGPGSKDQPYFDYLNNFFREHGLLPGH